MMLWPLLILVLFVLGAVFFVVLIEPENRTNVDWEDAE